jgi:hypothetical protein
LLPRCTPPKAKRKGQKGADLGATTVQFIVSVTLM